ncbi:MAG: MBL fold metallo-hydrolase [Candidatus Micrarchaeota archaeon]
MPKNVKVSFLGASHEVGRSGFLVDSGDKLLLDYGVKFGLNNAIEYPLPVKTNLDAIILSHAHLDHSGFIPNLFVDSSALTYLTPPSFGLSNLLWEDSLKIAGHNGTHAGFTEEELFRLRRYCFQVGYKKRLNVSKDWTMEFFDAGHILGSSLTKLTYKKEHSLLYTGDFNSAETRLHAGADLKVGKVDTVMIESTYGNRNHPPRKELEKVFFQEVQDIIDRGGWALIPAFAVGRGQEILMILDDFGINADVYYDGMGKTAAQIMLDNPSYLKDPSALKKALRKTIVVQSAKMRKQALKKPSVIVASAGMMQGGPILFYTQKLCNDKNSKVFFTGYQVEKTIGRTLLDHKKLVVDGVLYDSQLEVEKFDFSAHAQKDDLVKSLKKWNPEKIFLVHGDLDIMDAFKETLRGQGFNKIEAPKQGETKQLF